MFISKARIEGNNFHFDSLSKFTQEEQEFLIENNRVITTHCILNKYEASNVVGIKAFDSDWGDVLQKDKSFSGTYVLEEPYVFSRDEEKLMRALKERNWGEDNNEYGLILEIEYYE